MPPGRKPTTLTSRTDLSRMMERNRTTGSARATPGAAATSFARAAGITDAVVNGPELPAATTHASAPNARTMRWFSLVRLALAPESKSVIAKTSAVAATAIVNRRRRHCRSRTLTRHTSDECLHLRVPRLPSASSPPDDRLSASRRQPVRHAAYEGSTTGRAVSGRGRSSRADSPAAVRRSLGGEG